MEILNELSKDKLLPSLFVFDIDYTLWPIWIDTHVSGPPFKADPSNPHCVKDRHGKLIKLYSEVPEIFRLIKNCSRPHIAVASRTHEPEWARKVLSIMPFSASKDCDSVKFPASNSSKGVNYRSLADIIDYDEIYPGSKLKHFRSLHKKSGTPYYEMIFFDDEIRNNEVEQELGVHFVYVPKGMTLNLFLTAIKDFAKKRKNP
ncbi:6207_t:CDS:2 [Funneliformis geosporum]|uniref:8958_t:CDS:1 n=1 Tax=Funneliformis geosporum TaxID=1117311 RepID=A0A9W4SWS3_9GLOM|nr:6207_t:CDS:2 [Funneliformis geosporum]CAI2183718.1 8958_t:CDS:2 [Funneliformis geosporum]